MLLHRLEQRGLRARRRAIDLVGQHDVGEDRPAHEAKAPRAGRRVLLEDLGAGDVARHEIGRELDAAEVEVHRLGERAHHERFRKARHADEQRVAAGDERHEDLVEHALLADDAPLHLGAQPRRRGDQRVAVLRRAERRSSVHDRAERECDVSEPGGGGGYVSSRIDPSITPASASDCGLVENLPAAQLDARNRSCTLRFGKERLERADLDGEHRLASARPTIANDVPHLRHLDADRDRRSAPSATRRIVDVPRAQRR